MSKPVFVPQFPGDRPTEEWIAELDTADQTLPHWNWCGLCCLRSILLGRNDSDVPTLEEMYRQALDDHAVFRWIEGRVVGAYHHELARYAEVAFGLRARRVSELTTADLAAMIAGDSSKRLIASVAPEIRFKVGDEPSVRSGHLVLVFGVADLDGERHLRLHNSAGFESLGTAADALISEARFRACFSGRGIVVETRTTK